MDQIAASPLRYCAAEQFFELDGDDPRENTKGLLTYLGLWTRYPRIEQLAKAGCEKIINDAIQGSMNSRALNWRAKTMPAFFGVDKPTVKRLLAGGIGQKELEALELVRHGAFIDLWLAWLKSGSKRDKSGRPVLPVKGEKTA